MLSEQNKFILIVRLWISKNRMPQYEAYEKQAASIMREYGGFIERAFRQSDFDNDLADEIHIVSFPSRESYGEFRRDDRLSSLRDIRSSLIEATEIWEGFEINAYG